MRSFSSALGFIFGLLGLMWLSFGNMLLQPNDYGSAAGGDSIKNRFTLAYYVKHDQAGWHFSGMHYPFGEHVVYTDNQPILAMALGAVDKHLYPIADYSVGIMNALLFLSLILGGLCIWSILRRLGLPELWAIVGAWAISMLSPQILRFFAHFALGYTALIPMLWYCLWRGDASPRRAWFWDLLCLVQVVVMGLLHLYNALIAAVMLSAYALVYPWGQGLRGWLRAGRLVVIAALGMILLLALMKLTDPVLDRPASPYGIYAYKTNFEGLFLAPVGPFAQLWHSFVKVNKPDFEGWVYVGFWGVVVLAATLWRKLSLLRRGVWLPWLRHGQLNRYLWASLLCVIFATALPYILTKELLLDWLPPLRQFRSLGRFAWVFYYIFSVYIWYYAYLLYRRLSWAGMRTWGRTLALPIIVLGVLDIMGFYQYLKPFHHSENALQAKYPVQYEALLDSLGHKPSDFQAILNLPFNNVGNELFGRANSSQAMFWSMKAAYDLGLPIVGYEMSRNSLSRGLYSLQLISGDLISKQALRSVWPDTSRPLLLLNRPEENPSPQDARLLARAELLHRGPEVELYRLAWANLFRDSIEQARQVLFNSPDLIAAKSAEGHELRLSRPAKVYLRSFEDNTMDTSFIGKGAIRLAPDQAALDVQVEADSAMQEWEVRFWIRPMAEYNAAPWFHYRQWDAQGKMIQEVGVPVDLSQEARGAWIACSLRFRVAEAGNRVAIFLPNPHWIADEFILRPTDVQVYHRLSAQAPWCLNGYPLEH